MKNSFLFLLTVLSSVISDSHEKCYKKFCYAWNGEYKLLKNATKCQSPYWNLEIYDDYVLGNVEQFITNINLGSNYLVPLGMTCIKLSCKWNKLNGEAKFNKVHPNYLHNSNTVLEGRKVYFMASNISVWRWDNIDIYKMAIICMKRNEKQDEHNMLIIGVVLGLASLALLMLMIALLVVVFRRKRKRLKSCATRSRSFENYRTTHLLNPVPSPKSSNYADIAPISEPPSTYVNPLKLPNCSSESTNILYADLDWSAEQDSKLTEITSPHLLDSKAEKANDLYENHSSFKVVGPLGDEYALVCK